MPAPSFAAWRGARTASAWRVPAWRWSASGTRPWATSGTALPEPCRFLTGRLRAGPRRPKRSSSGPPSWPEQGEWDRAAADWDRVVQLDPESRDRLLAIGWWVVGPLAASYQAEGEPDSRSPSLHANASDTSLSWRQASVSTDGGSSFDEPLPQEEAALGTAARVLDDRTTRLRNVPGARRPAALAQRPAG